MAAAVRTSLEPVLDFPTPRATAANLPVAASALGRRANERLAHPIRRFASSLEPRSGGGSPHSVGRGSARSWNLSCIEQDLRYAAWSRNRTPWHDNCPANDA